MLRKEHGYKYELSVVSGAYDEGEADDAGKYQSHRSGD